MKIAIYSTREHDEASLTLAAEKSGLTLTFFEHSLNQNTVSSAQGFDGVCLFVQDHVDAGVIKSLKAFGVQVIALRCAGYNNIDLNAAREQGIQVLRVPAYSPEAVAEHAVALILTLNRKTHRSFNRVREGNFDLKGLMGFDLYGKTVGVVGTGMIGKAFCRIMRGFGCQVIAYDFFPDLEFSKATETKYVGFHELLETSDIISLHCPLSDDTFHLFGEATFSKMKKGAMLINTGRGALIDTQDAIIALKNQHLGFLGIDVYEEESGLFFRDLSSEIILDDCLIRLMAFPNVLITGHQGFFTKEAVDAIAAVTIENLSRFKDQLPPIKGREIVAPGNP